MAANTQKSPHYADLTHDQMDTKVTWIVLFSFHRRRSRSVLYGHMNSGTYPAEWVYKPAADVAKVLWMFHCRGLFYNVATTAWCPYICRARGLDASYR